MVESMAMNQRKLSFVDRLCDCADNALRTLASTPRANRLSPGNNQANDSQISAEERRHSAALMRVNHTGEVCAQALYQGQALTAKLPGIRAEMEQAAQEEIDHLAWCHERLEQLDSRPSLLNPLFYGASFLIGAGAGAISDRISLGFVAATEDQVCAHLQRHLGELPEGDQASRAIVNQMHEDEDSHRQSALRAGGIEFPDPVKKGMTLVSRLMTETVSRI